MEHDHGVLWESERAAPVKRAESASNSADEKRTATTGWVPGTCT